MNEQSFETRFTELLDQIEKLPAGERERMRQLADDTRQRRQRMSDTVSQLQESLDYLRLSVKYLVFDLEATRRENQYLRQLLHNDADNEPEGAD